MKKSSILAAISGNVIEWYDFTLYVFLAPVLAQNFFPQHNHSNAILLTFLVFALGFFIRPLGSIIIGHLGDRLGRVATLKMTILFISLPTIFIGLLPTHNQWGIYASLVFVILRLLQGLCIGGEFAGSMIYLTEMAPANKRAFISCMTNNGSNFGILLATLAASFFSGIMSETAFYSYGWRIPFILGGTIGLLGLWLRGNIVETPVFQALSTRTKAQSIPLLTVLRNHKKAVLNVFLLLAMPAIGNYALIDFMSTYLSSYFNYTLTSALQIQAVYIMLTFVLITIFAKVSDYYGRRIMLMIAGFGYICCSIPCFYLLQATGSYKWLLPLVVFYCIEQSTTPAAMVEYFPSAVRFTGISTTYNLAMGLVGGTAPLVNTWLINKFHNPLIIAYYLIAGAVTSLIVILIHLPKSFGSTHDLISCSNNVDVPPF
jgi:MHS family proline/betaine transporter-like MFS transporter